MKKSFVTIFVLTLFCLQARAEKWVIATTEWPPYTCSHCPENGAGAKALRDALHTQGIDVEFVFTTWTKDIEDARENRAVGYFPAWIEAVRPGFHRSVALFQSPIGLLERKDEPLNWKKLTDLKGKTIGVSKDYGNTIEFNRLVQEGVIKTEVVISDDTNIRKVAAHKLDGAILDINNALYFLNTSVTDLLSKVEANAKIIKMKTLHVSWGPTHADADRRLREGLKQVNTQQIVQDYLKKYDPFCQYDFGPVTNPLQDQ